jgi:hypothetical protein
MESISDLTRDTRPSLRELLISSIYDTIEMDRRRDNNNIELIRYENHTFYYRVLYYFLQRAVLYYQNKEIEDWSKKEILKEHTLPKIDEG